MGEISYLLFNPIPMRENIEKVLSNERGCKSQTGISKNEFEILIPFFARIDEKTRAEKSKWKRWYGWKPPVLKTSRERLFYVLWYFKNYSTFDTAWTTWCTSKSSAHSWFSTYFPMLKEALKQLWVIPPETPEEFVGKYGKDKNLWYIFVDATEREIIRNKKK